MSNHPILKLPRPAPERARALVFADPRSAALLAQLGRIAPSDAAVLVTGETGTGKEIIARELHARSHRRDQPFVAVNCGALTPSLIESELFGHDRGAFTGAAGAQPGWFETADGGTLFLDELGELPLAMQVKLLRVLQERQVVRLGSRRPLTIDVRVVAATNVDLEAAVAAGRFRADLFYRLDVARLDLPPLRERRGDILPAAAHFLATHAGRDRRVPTLTDEAAIRLLDYQWPGNFRQLENVIQQALLLCPNDRLDAADLRLPAAPTAGTRSTLELRPSTAVSAPRPLGAAHAPGASTAAPDSPSAPAFTSASSAAAPPESFSMPAVASSPAAPESMRPALPRASLALPREVVAPAALRLSSTAAPESLPWTAESMSSASQREPATAPRSAATSAGTRTHVLPSVSAAAPAGAPAVPARLASPDAAVPQVSAPLASSDAGAPQVPAPLASPDVAEPAVPAPLASPDAAAPSAPAPQASPVAAAPPPDAAAPPPVAAAAPAPDGSGDGDGLERALLGLFAAGLPDLHKRLEQQIFRAAYRYSRRNQLQTARLLGISRNIVRARLLELGELSSATPPPPPRALDLPPTDRQAP